MVLSLSHRRERVRQLSWLTRCARARRRFGLILGIGCVCGLAFALSTAVSEERGDPPVFEPLGPRPAGFDPGKGPFEDGRGRDEFAEAVKEAEERATERDVWLRSSEAVKQRTDSRVAFSGLADGEVLGVLVGAFGDELPGAAPLELDDVTDGRRVQRFINDKVVVLAGEDGRPGTLFDISINYIL